MFLFTIEATPNSKKKLVEDLSDVGGAYVNCWISFKDIEIAEKIAKWAIKDSGWIVGKTTETSKIQKRILKKKKDKQYYSEALKYGYCLVFNMWPLSDGKSHS